MLVLWCKTASQATRVPIHPQYPLVGTDAFRTATGVHAAAIIKAEKKGNNWLSDRIYSGVPAGMFGKEQEIEVGHYSGESNVIYWLKKRGYEPTKDLVAAVLGAAKSGNHVLGDAEIQAVIDRVGGRGTGHAGPSHSSGGPGPGRGRRRPRGRIQQRR